MKRIVPGCGLIKVVNRSILGIILKNVIIGDTQFYMDIPPGTKTDFKYVANGSYNPVFKITTDKISKSFTGLENILVGESPVTWVFTDNTLVRTSLGVKRISDAIKD